MISPYVRMERHQRMADVYPANQPRITRTARAAISFRKKLIPLPTFTEYQAFRSPFVSHSAQRLRAEYGLHHRRLDFLDILFLLLLFHRETTQNLSMLLSYGIFAFSPLWGGLLFSPPHPYLLQSRCKYALENTPILGYKISHDKTFICRRIILRLR